MEGMSRDWGHDVPAAEFYRQGAEGRLYDDRWWVSAFMDAVKAEQTERGRRLRSWFEGTKDTSPSARDRLRVLYQQRMAFEEGVAWRERVAAVARVATGLGPTPTVVRPKEPDQDVAARQDQTDRKVEELLAAVRSLQRPPLKPRTRR